MYATQTLEAFVDCILETLLSWRSEIYKTNPIAKATEGRYREENEVLVMKARGNLNRQYNVQDASSREHDNEINDTGRRRRTLSITCN